jgi:hypothetical protein
MSKIWLPVICSLFTIILFSTSAFAQENNTTNATLTPTATPTSTATPNATLTPTATVSTTTPIATGKIFSIAPSLSLTSTKTTAEATSPAIITLSMVNPVVNEVNLVVQPILKVPSGVDVIGSSFTLSGANQYTGLFTVRPGESNHVTIQITSEELGSKTIEAQMIYFPENNKQEYHQLQYTMTIYIKEKPSVSPTPIPPTIVPTTPPSTRIPGFEAIIAVIGMLVAMFLVKKS